MEITIKLDETLVRKLIADAFKDEDNKAGIKNWIRLQIQEVFNSWQNYRTSDSEKLNNLLKKISIVDNKILDLKNMCIETQEDLRQHTEAKNNG